MWYNIWIYMYTLYIHAYEKLYTLGQHNRYQRVNFNFLLLWLDTIASVCIQLKLWSLTCVVVGLSRCLEYKDASACQVVQSKSECKIAWLQTAFVTWHVTQTLVNRLNIKFSENNWKILCLKYVFENVINTTVP